LEYSDPGSDPLIFVAPVKSVYYKVSPKSIKTPIPEIINQISRD